MDRPLPKKLRSLLFSHKRWAQGNQKYLCANFRGQDLSHMNFSGRNLRGANFSRCNLEETDFRNAQLMGCNFSGANLYHAKLASADMTGAILRRAYLGYINFGKAIMVGVDVTGADFTGASMYQAQFGADKESKFFMAHFCIVPDGELFGWKALRDGRLAKLLIPVEAKRSSGFTRRCRAEYALVLGVVDDDGNQYEDGTSKRDPNLIYRVGETVTADGWDTDWKNECAPGINFFITREEAEAYG